MRRHDDFVLKNLPCQGQAGLSSWKSVELRLAIATIFRGRSMRAARPRLSLFCPRSRFRGLEARPVVIYVQVVPISPAGYKSSYRFYVAFPSGTSTGGVVIGDRRTRTFITAIAGFHAFPRTRNLGHPRESKSPSFSDGSAVKSALPQAGGSSSEAAAKKWGY